MSHRILYGDDSERSLADIEFGQTTEILLLFSENSDYMIVKGVKAKGF